MGMRIVGLLLLAWGIASVINGADAVLAADESVGPYEFGVIFGFVLGIGLSLGGAYLLLRRQP